jgi:hypothetical protein
LISADFIAQKSGKSIAESFIKYKESSMLDAFSKAVVAADTGGKFIGGTDLDALSTLCRDMNKGYLAENKVRNLLTNFFA